MSNSTNDAYGELYRLIELADSGKLPIKHFCESFERIYNFELDKNILSIEETGALSELFDAAVWFSPYPEERKKIPNYLGEKEILDAIKKAIKNLKPKSI